MVQPHRFADRHIGPTADERAKMLAVVGYGSLDDLVAAALPQSIRSDAPLAVPAAATEDEVLGELRDRAGRNRVLTPMIGLGWHDTVTPPVLRRAILENPGWYTAYTPYQPEISQGRLEALLNFQTVVADLTALPVAGASLLDESTAAAEAMSLCRRSTKSTSRRFIVDTECHPHTLAVMLTRAEPIGIDIEVADLAEGLPEGEYFGVLVAYPGSTGRLFDPTDLVAEAHRRGALVAATTDLLALTLLRPPGEWGADIAVGSAQRFGVPMGFGGPHAGFMAVRSGLERGLPGRLVGVSVDADGAPAYRLALQTREQHIRREKATSNICTAQVLLAVRRLPRAGRPHRDRPPGPHQGDQPRRRARGRRRRAGASRGLRHRHRDDPRPGRRGGGRRARGRRQPASHRCGPGRDQLRRTDHPGARRGGVRRIRGGRAVGGGRGARPSGRGAPGAARRADTHLGVPHPPGVRRAPLRDGDDALPAPARRP
jgi:glycine cleavage system pyridoxal-binding protein P